MPPGLAEVPGVRCYSAVPALTFPVEEVGARPGRLLRGQIRSGDDGTSPTYHRGRCVRRAGEGLLKKAHFDS